MKAKVYFSEQITPEKVVGLYKAVGLELPGKVAVKVHSGEPGNQNFLTPEFWQPMVETVHGTIVECNTAYPGERNTTNAHRRTMIKHGWSKLFDVDILDAEGPDLELPIPNGKRIQKNLVGKDIKNYDSMLVLSHFKGHPMGGFGGALKQLSIGCASSAGKANIHGAGYDPMIYITDYAGYVKYDLSEVMDYPLWYARYDVDAPSFYYDFAMWQYSSKGSVDGIKGNVDMDIWFIK